MLRGKLRIGKAFSGYLNRKVKRFEKSFDDMYNWELKEKRQQKNWKREYEIIIKSLKTSISR